MLTTLSVAALLGAAATNAPVVPTPSVDASLDLVPADTFFLVEVESVAELHEAVAASAYFRFLTAPDGVLAGSGLLAAMQAESSLDVDLRALVRLLGATEPLDQATVDALPADAVEAWRFVRGFKGSFTLWLSGSPAPGAGLGFGLVMEPGRPVDAFAAELESLFDHAPVWREHGGLAVATETEGALETQSSFVVQMDRHLVFCGSNSTARALDQLDRLVAIDAGEEVATLSQNPRWIESAAATAGLGQGRLFVDLVPLMAALEVDAVGQSLPVDTPFSLSEFVEDLGLLDMRWIGARVYVGTGEQLSFDVEMHVPEQGLLARVLDLTSGGVPTHFLSRFGQDVVRASAARFDVGGLVDLVLEVATEYGADDEGALTQQIEALPMMLGFDPLGDLVHQTTGEFAFVQTEPTSSGDDIGMDVLLGGRTTFVMGLHDSARFEESLWDALAFAESAAEMPLPLADEALGGRPYTRVTSPLGDLFFAIGRDALAVGVDPQSVLRALRPAASGEVSPLDDPRFGRAFNEHSGAIAVEVTHTGAYVGSMFDVFGSLSSVAANSGEPVPAELEALARYGALARERFSGHATQVIERTPRGLRLHFDAR